LQSPQLTSSNDAPPTGPNFGGDGKPDLQMLAQLMHHRSVSGSSTGPPGNVVPQAIGRVMSGPVATQMQKLIEQTQRMRPDSISSQGPGLVQGQGTGVGVGVVQHGQTLSGQSLSEGTGKPLQIWQGSLTWSGTNPNGGKKEVTVHVVARTSNPSERCVGFDLLLFSRLAPDSCSSCSRVETWPQAMSLAPIRSVSMSDLRLWLARFKPIMCTFMPQTDGTSDAQVNVTNLKMLVNLLATKSYVSSFLTLPSIVISS
jgi:mediator of RNA polymerase II transcription subunit 25